MKEIKHPPPQKKNVNCFSMNVLAFFTYRSFGNLSQLWANVLMIQSHEKYFDFSKTNYTQF